MEKRHNNPKFSARTGIRRSHKLGILFAIGLVAMLLISSSSSRIQTNATPGQAGVEGDFSQNALPIPIIPPEGQGQSNTLDNAQNNAPSSSLDTSLSLNHMGGKPERSPWRSLALTPDAKYMAIGLGHRSNAHIHQITVYQWSEESRQFKIFANITEKQFKGDPMDVEFADLDGNSEWELYVASSNGYVYSFEMNSSSTTQPFNLVWKSPFLVKALSISIGDLSGDSRMEILAAGWKNRAYVLGFGNLTAEWDNLHVLWESENLRDQVLEAEIGDFNGDSVLDIALALRHGKLVIFEQVANKTLCSLHQHQAVPDKADDDDDDSEEEYDENKKQKTFEECYNMTFSTTDYLWNKILELESYDLDLDNDDELGIVVKSQDVLILDYNENGYFLDRVTTDPQAWERSGAYPIDYFPDKVLYSNDTFFDGVVPEPMSWLDPRNRVSPYTSGLEANSQNHFTRFSGNNSWSLLDWGNYEEIVGGGNQGTDLTISLQNPYNGSLNNLSIVLTNEKVDDDDDDDHELSDWLLELQELATKRQVHDHHDCKDHDDDHENDGKDHNHHHGHKMHGKYAVVDTLSMTKSPDNLTIMIDIDPAMIHSKMLSARYMYIWFNSSQGATLDIRTIETTRINMRLSTVRSIGYDTVVLDLSPETFEQAKTPVLIASTAAGNLLVFSSAKPNDQGTPLVKLVSNSYQEQRFTTAIDGAWDIKPIPTASIVPNWINPQPQEEFSSLLTSPITQFFIGEDLDPTLASSTSFKGDLFIVMEGPKILWMSDPSHLSSSSTDSDSNAIFDQVTTYYASMGVTRISIALADLETSPFSPTPFGSHPELIVSSGQNSLDIWSLDSSFKFQFLKTIPFSEIMGINQTLQDALSSSNETNFQLSAGDFDADGSDDIVLTNGTKLYLITLKKTENDTSYYFDDEFFATIEKALSSYGYHFFRRVIENIAAFDANGDNIADLMVSLFPRPGFTFFENQMGRLNNSREFVEKRSLVHYRPLQTTLTNYNYEFAAIWGTNQTFPLVSSLFLAINQTNDVAVWEASQMYQRSWIATTTTQVIQLTVNLANSPGGYNWGLQYFEQWADQLSSLHRHHHHKDHEHDDDDEENDTHDEDSCDHGDSDHDFGHHHGCEEYAHLEELVLEPSIVVKNGDTDGDGLIDGIEGFSRPTALKTNIADPDTDGDGLSDTLELCLGLDPRSDDTDGDLIPDGLDIHDWWDHYKEHCLPSSSDDDNDHDDDQNDDLESDSDNDDHEDETAENEDTEDNIQDSEDDNETSSADNSAIGQNLEQETHVQSTSDLETSSVSSENNEKTAQNAAEFSTLQQSGKTKEEIGLEKSQLQLEINEITFNINDVTKTRAAQKEYSPIDKVSMAQEQTLMESIAIRSLSAFFPQEIPIIFKAGKA